VVSGGPRVLFVSKPIVPPWHDGSKNLVRDVAAHLVRARPTVLTVPGAPDVGPRVVNDPVYAETGSFSPALFANARVMARLLTGDPHDVWAFAFAPNGASSGAGAMALRARRAAGWRGAAVQIVPSAPRSFDGVGRLLFGDHVVVMSQHTRGRLVGAGVRHRDVRVIPPCAPAPRVAAPEEVRAIRLRLDLGDAPIVLYPGDYEISRGARTLARAIPRVLRAVPEARFVYACRPKTRNAESARLVVEKALHTAQLDAYVRHVGEIDDMHAMLAASAVVAAPIDDLYGKVDLPLVLLEALAVGVPMVLARGGPLEAITSARLIEPRDEVALAREIAALLENSSAAASAAAEGRALHAARFAPQVVADQYDDLFDQAHTAALAPPRPTRV